MPDPSASLVEQLQQRVSDLELLAYRSAHDLKGPLVTIAGFLKGLAPLAKTGRWDEFDTDLAHIAHAINHMEHQLDDLLQLARLDRPSGPPQPLLISQLVEQATALFPSQQVQVTVTGDGLPVLGQEPQLVAVFQNLFENTIKLATDPNRTSTVEVDARREGDHVLVRVRDHGPGIPAADHDRVFEPFVRLRAKQPGTGLGLYIIKRTIEWHHGRVWIESPQSGSGTVVGFTLPIAPA